jgi:2,4-dienoyl-CoA reductase-like NADH-dependent reductase (Old Yellow Enzyme family)
LAKEIKHYSSKPIAYAGFIADLEHAEQVMAENQIDLIGLGRAQFADPGLINKYASGNDSSVMKCKFDNYCLFSFAGKEEGQVYCTVNPQYKRPKQEKNEQI